MKISEYPESTSLMDNSVFIVDDGGVGTRKITAKNASNYFGTSGSGGVGVASDPVWVSHRNTYRGKNLGTIFSEDQKKAIFDGSFNDLYVGDYWEMANNRFRIVDINFLPSETNHVVVFPDNILYKAKMYNNDGATNGGYLGSDLAKTGLSNALNTYVSIFGSENILEYDVMLSNDNIAHDDGGSGSATAKIKIVVPSLAQISGLATDQTTIGFSRGSRLSALSLNPKLIFISESYTLNDPQIGKNRFFAILNNGLIAPHWYSNDVGIRPIVGITG